MDRDGLGDRGECIELKLVDERDVLFKCRFLFSVYFVVGFNVNRSCYVQVFTQEKQVWVGHFFCSIFRQLFWAVSVSNDSRHPVQ